MKVRSIFIFVLIIFITTAIIYPLSVYITSFNVEDNTVYNNEEILGSKIAYEDFSSNSYFQNTTNKIRPYIKKEDAQKQVESISQIHNIEPSTLNTMIDNNTYNNLFYEYVNINTLNMQLYMYLND